MLQARAKEIQVYLYVALIFRFDFPQSSTIKLNTQTYHRTVCFTLTKPLTLRWSESTLSVPYRSCKTAWPVSQLESLFLPQFPLEDRHEDSKYKKLPDISKGAFGVICPILDLETNELFALKVLSKSKV